MTPYHYSSNIKDPNTRVLPHSSVRSLWSVTLFYKPS
nr:MAG TPA: hypothetical protein [Bacteriophage sp.]